MDTNTFWNNESNTTNINNRTYHDNNDNDELTITAPLFGLQIFALVLNIVDVLLHIAGIYALLSLYSRSRQKVQRLFLIHLSFSIAMVNAVEFFRKLPLLFLTTRQSRVPYMKIEPYIKIFTFTGVSMVPYFVMIFLTADRLANAALSFHYHKYWSKNKTKHLLTITWTSCLLVMTCIQLAFAYRYFSWEILFFTYVYPIIECTFILTAFITYASIIGIFYRSRKNFGRERRGGCWKMERIAKTRATKVNSANFRKQYFIPILLISTFIIFMTIPDFTYLVVAVIYKRPSEMLSTLCSCSYAVSNLADAAIYVFFVPDIRHFLAGRVQAFFQKLKKCDLHKSIIGDEDAIVIYNRRVSRVVLHQLSKEECRVRKSAAVLYNKKVDDAELKGSEVEDQIGSKAIHESSMEIRI